MAATQPMTAEILRRKTAPLLLCERANATPHAIAFRSKHLGIYRERSWRDYAAAQLLRILEGDGIPRSSSIGSDKVAGLTNRGETND